MQILINKSNICIYTKIYKVAIKKHCSKRLSYLFVLYEKKCLFFNQTFLNITVLSYYKAILLRCRSVCTTVVTFWSHFLLTTPTLFSESNCYMRHYPSIPLYVTSIIRFYNIQISFFFEHFVSA